MKTPNGKESNAEVTKALGPLIRLEMENVRGQVIAYLSQDNEELQEAIGAAVSEAIENFNWAGDIERLTYHYIHQGISDFLTVHGGAVLRNAVSRALDEILNASAGDAEGGAE